MSLCSNAAANHESRQATDAQMDNVTIASEVSEVNEVVLEEEEPHKLLDDVIEEDFTSIEFKIPRSRLKQNLFIVNNEIQSSSCVLFYLQYLENYPENEALIETFLHLTRERLISYMKNKVQLGYVVSCDIRKGEANMTLGLRITVESQYPLQIVHSTIEESLASLESFLDHELSEASFEVLTFVT